MSFGFYPRQVVVLTIVNETNHVFKSISSRLAPEFSAGTLARTAYFELLRAGFSQEAEFQGDVYTVVGFVRQRFSRDGDGDTANVLVDDEA